MTSTSNSEPKRFRGSTTTYALIVVAIIIVVAILLYFLPVSVTGSVSDASSGAALADVMVALSNGQQVASDASGHFSFKSPRFQPVTASIDESVFEPWQDAPEFIPVPLVGGKLTASLQPVVVSGLVTDAVTGAPVAGATASFDGQQSITNAEGRFELSRLPRSGAPVTVSADGFVERTLPLNPTDGDPASLAIYPDGLHGLVLDAASGAPVAGATVRLNDASSESAADGFYYFPPATGTGELAVAAPGYLPGSASVNAEAALAGEQAVDVSLEPTVLTGTVLDGKTGAPVAGATITAGSQSVTSDQDGRYRLERLSGGDLAISAAHSDYESAELPVDETANLLAGEALDVTLLPPHLAGTVFNNVTGSPLAGATITAGDLSAVSDDQGQFILWTTETPLDVTVNAIGYETAAGQFSEHAPLSLALEPKGLVIKVLDNAGQPVSGAAVTSLRSEATTDEQGVALLPLLEAGDPYTVTLTGFAPAAQVYSGEAQADLTIAPDTVAGAAVDATTGEPVPGAVIYVYDRTVCQGEACRGTEPAVLVDASADGAFQVSGMPADPQLMIKAPGYSLLFPETLAAGDCGEPYCLQAELQPFEARGTYIKFDDLGNRSLIVQTLDQIAASPYINAVVVDLKDERGLTAWEPQNAIARELDTEAQNRMSAQEFVELAKERGIYTIARFLTFQDNALGEGRPEWAIRRKSNPDEVWYESPNSAIPKAYVSAFRPEVREYEIALAEELAALGVDELQFDYFRFPGRSNPEDYIYGAESTAESRREAITSFSHELMEALKPYGVFTSIDVFGSILVNGNEPFIGQNLEDMMVGVDYLSPMIYPDVWEPRDFPECTDPMYCPYKVIYDSVARAIDLTSPPTKIRPWLQGYPTFYSPDYPGGVASYRYSIPEFLLQRQAAEDAQAAGWLFWSGGANMPEEIFGPMPSLAELEAQVRARQGGRAGPY